MFQVVYDLILGCENLTIKISGTVETRDTYNLINSKLHCKLCLSEELRFFDVQSVLRPIKEWLGLAGTSKSSCSNPPAMAKGIFH